MKPTLFYLMLLISASFTQSPAYGRDSKSAQDKKVYRTVNGCPCHVITGRLHQTGGRYHIVTNEKSLNQVEWTIEPGNRERAIKDHLGKWVDVEAQV
jgi:hypothetical protein